MNKREGRKGFPPRGKLSAKRTDEGDLAAIASSRGSAAHVPLIRPCGATFPPSGEGKKHLTQLHRRVRFMY